MAHALPMVYLNGEFIARDAAMISPFDRGFLYGDGVYEMLACHAGRLFRLDDHLARLARSLAEARITNPRTHYEWRELLERLVRANDAGNQNVYVQVTRGMTLERDHRFPAGTRPTIFAMSQPATRIPAEWLENGIAAITQEDTRWSRCDIKATSLIANVLLRQAAEEAGVQETLLLRDGHALEFSASSVFIVKDGRVRTTPNGHNVLPGVTGIVVRELLHDAGLPLDETPIPEALLRSADEIWLASTTRDVLPVTVLDGRPVGDGAPGKAWRTVHAAFQAMKAELAA